MDVCAAVGAALRDLGRPGVDGAVHLVCTEAVGGPGSRRGEVAVRRMASGQRSLGEHRSEEDIRPRKAMRKDSLGNHEQRMRLVKKWCWLSDWLNAYIVFLSSLT